MTDFIEAAGALILLLAQLGETLGPGWTVILVLGLAVAGAAYKIWSKSQVERAYQAALDEKERTIQRLSEECRGWRVYFGMDVLKMGRQKAEKVFQRNEFATPQEARQHLEKPAKPKKKRRRGRP